jgi:hypothetical protein
MTPAPGPTLNDLMTAAAADAARDYDVSTQLVRWAERQRSEERAAAIRRRRRTELLVAAALVVIAGVVAVVWASGAGRTGRDERSVAPPARELSESGLPIGSFRTSVQVSHVNPTSGLPTKQQVSFHLRVRAGGTGSLVRSDRPDAPWQLTVAEPAPGRVRLLARPVACPGSLVLALSFTATRDAVTVTGAQVGACLGDPALAESLVGAVFTRTG